MAVLPVTLACEERRTRIPTLVLWLTLLPAMVLFGPENTLMPTSEVALTVFFEIMLLLESLVLIPAWPSVTKFPDTVFAVEAVEFEAKINIPLLVQRATTLLAMRFWLESRRKIRS